MQRKNVNSVVLLSLVLIISSIFLTMIRQFLMPLFMAGLFSAMLSPVHQWLTDRLGNRETLASIITVIGILLLVLIPLSILIGIVVAQAFNVSQSITPFIHSLLNEPTSITKYTEKIPYYEQLMPYRDQLIQRAGQLVGTTSAFLIDALQSMANLTMKAIFGTVIMLYSMFYFLTMGDLLLKKILYFLPLHDEDEQRLLKRFTSVTRATIKGTLIIGIMQGTTCGLAFAFAGIESPVFWGTIMAVTSIIPAFGTAIVWGPALIILALTGNVTGVIILAVGCGALAGNLDNLIRPKLVGKDTEMHDLLVLFSTLGGISMFGLLGIIIGPIIAALFITIWEIYGVVFKDYLPDVAVVLRVRQHDKDEITKKSSKTPADTNPGRSDPPDPTES